MQTSVSFSPGENIKIDFFFIIPNNLPRGLAKTSSHTKRLVVWPIQLLVDTKEKLGVGGGTNEQFGPSAKKHYYCGVVLDFRYFMSLL
jgi:hypothetical protein